MNITYIGHDNECSTKICNHLSEFHDVTLITNSRPFYEVECKTIVEKTLWTNNYFDDHKVDIVIYSDINENFSLLNDWLSSASGKVKHFLIVKQDSFQHKSIDSTPIEKLLQKSYAKDSSTQITIINTSTLYGSVTTPLIMDNIVKSIIKRNIIEIPSGFKTVCDALHIDDFCVFLDNYIEDIDNQDDANIYVHSGYLFSIDDLLEKITDKYPQAEVLCDKNTMYVEDEQKSVHFKGWTPKHSFLEDFPSVLENVEGKIEKKKKEKKSIAHKTLGKIISLLVLFFVVELYTNFMEVASELQFVDVRVIFIAISALIFGKKYSISAALLCSIASVLQALTNGYRWYVLFFHVNNWIPIVIYIVFAIVIGTYSDRIRYSKKSKS